MSAPRTRRLWRAALAAALLSTAMATGLSGAATPAEKAPSGASGLSEINLSEFERLQAPHWGRDPFLLPSKDEVFSDALVVTAILHNPDSKKAIVNGRLVGVGDDVNGRRVLSIAVDHITVREGKTIKRLTLSSFTAEKTR